MKKELPQKTVTVKSADTKRKGQVFMLGEKYTQKYEDIINLPHHRSKTRPNMPVHDRAAQFAPFAALSGHSEAIDKTARANEVKIDDENR